MSIKEPYNRPKERIEQLLSSDPQGFEHRNYDRMPVEPGTEVFIPVICKGEIVDVSKRGLSVRFNPSDAPSLVENGDIVLTMEFESRGVKIPAKVRRVENRFGVVVLGLEFDPSEIETE